MGQSFRIKKGLKINLVGEAEKVLSNSTSKHFAIKPTDFVGLIPKLVVKEGDEVEVSDFMTRLLDFYEKGK